MKKAHKSLLIIVFVGIFFFIFIILNSSSFFIIKTEVKKDEVDPYNFLMRVSKRMEGYTNYYDFITSQEIYEDVIESGMTIISPIKENNESRFKRIFMCDVSNKYWRVSTRINSYLPYVYVDSSNSVPQVMIWNKNTKHNALTNLLYDLDQELTEKRCYIRIRSISDKIIMVKYFGCSDESMRFLYKWKEMISNRKLKDLIDIQIQYMKNINEKEKKTQ